LACNPSPATVHLWASPTAPLTQTASAVPSTGARPSVSSPSSTASSAAIGSSSSSTKDSGKPAPSTNSTGAIVGGVIGALAFLCFVGFAIYVLRRLRSLRADRKPASNSSYRFEDKHGEALSNHQGEHADQQGNAAYPVELAPDMAPLELPLGGNYGTPELHGQHQVELNGSRTA
ncbi:MAG: hypothetical protein Q9218_002737, partial [Villophora microphyllina]